MSAMVASGGRSLLCGRYVDLGSAGLCCAVYHGVMAYLGGGTGIGEILGQLRAQPDRVLAIELQWGGSSFDKVAGRWQNSLELCAIVAAPGWQDSRFRSVVVAELPANDQTERSGALTLAQAVGARLAVPCSHPDLGPDGEDFGQTHFSRWVAAQGPSPVIGFEVRWQAEYWTDEGVPQTASGVEQASGRNGHDACDRARAALHARLGSSDGPVTVRCTVPELHENTGREDPFPMGIESGPRRWIDVAVEDMRRMRRAGDGCGHIVRWLMMRALPAVEPDTVLPSHAVPTTMALMWAMHQAFGIPLEELALIGPWRSGHLSDADLDIATEAEWSGLDEFGCGVSLSRWSLRGVSGSDALSRWRWVDG
jgi:hypothetical protein